MKFRPAVVLAAVLMTAVLEVVALAPARAAVPDPVTGLAVSGQVQGSGQSWTVSASWTAADGADSYRVAITDQADGTNTAGSQYTNKDVAGTSASLTTDRLVSGRTYYVAVRSLNGTDVGTAVTASFVAMALDTEGPTGTFTLSQNHGYIGSGELFRKLPAPFRAAEDIYDNENPESEFEIGFQVRQTTISDDTTPAPQIGRQLRTNTGRPLHAWNDNSAWLIYNEAGVYHPEVVLTDQYGNTSTIALPTITIEEDGAAPVVRITRPRLEMRGLVGGWRVIRGTVHDAKSGPLFVAVMVVERRYGIWWAYDFDERHWVKGFTGLQKTLEGSEVTPAFIEPFNGHWRTPFIRGLRRGLLHVETIAVDNAFNLGIGPIIHRRIERAS